jgi:hypothetical protein
MEPLLREPADSCTEFAVSSIGAQAWARRALEKDGLLRVEYGGVTILDLEGLRKP